MGPYRVGVLLAALGPELAARVLTHLDDEAVETAMEAVASLGSVRPEERDHILTDLEKSVEEASEMVWGGVNTARSMLESAIGPEKAALLLEKVAAAPSSDEPNSLSQAVRSVPPASLAALLADEHPQIIALLASNLSVDSAAEFIAALPRSIQAAVTARLVDLEEPTPLALEHLRSMVLAKLRNVKASVSGAGNGGPRRVAEMLGRMRRSKEMALVEDLEKESPDAVQRVNQYRVTVEQILSLEGRVLQRILRDVDAAQMPTLMKGLDETFREVILSNMSGRAAERLREEIENLGPVKVRDIEAAQQQLIVAARDLEERGEVRLRDETPGEEDDDA